MSVIAEEIPRKTNWSWLSAAGAIVLLMALLTSEPFDVNIEDTSADPGDGSLLNGESRCDELGSNCLGVFSGQAVDYVSTGEWGGWELAENPRVQTSKFLQHANVAGQARPAFYIQDGTGWSVTRALLVFYPRAITCFSVPTTNRPTSAVVLPVPTISTFS
jgi:hypothetical protein